MTAAPLLVRCALHDGADIDACGCPALDSPGAIAYRGLLVKARAEIARLTAELAAARAEVDCGQDGPCAKAPGCARHWQERNRELVAELAAARAVTAGVCRYLDCAASDLLAVVTSLYETRARAISDATAARGTVGGLLAAEPVGAIVECFDGDTWLQFCIFVDRSDRAVSGRWHDRRGRWCRWSVGGRYHVGYSFALPARLVPAAEADADPNQRGPLPKGG